MAQIPNFYTHTDRYGKPTYFYARRVPKDLQKIIGKTIFKIKLGPIMHEAISEVYKLNDQHTEMFRVLRKPNHKDYETMRSLLVAHGVPFRRLSQDELDHLPIEVENVLDRYPDVDDMPSGIRQVHNVLVGKEDWRISDAVDFYKNNATRSTPEMNTAERVGKLLVSIVGNLKVQDYRRPHVAQFVKARQAIVDDEGNRSFKNSTIQKDLKALARIIKYSMIEKDFQQWVIPFYDYELPTDDSEPIEEFSKEKWNELYDKCNTYRANKKATRTDDIRAIILLMMTTGSRISESAHILVQDLHLDEKGKEYIDFYPNPLRRLKTKNSYRSVPLVDANVVKLLKAIYEDRKEYGNDAKLFAKSSNARFTCGKWIRENIELEDNVVPNHSLRHTISGSLKDVITPPQIMDNLLGWSNGAMRERYGSRADAETGRPYLSKALSQLRK
jgi:integrase